MRLPTLTKRLRPSSLSIWCCYFGAPDASKIRHTVPWGRGVSPAILFLLGGRNLDCLGHCQDLFPARLVVMSCLCVLLEVLYKFVVGIGSFSEPASGGSGFFSPGLLNFHNHV